MNITMIGAGYVGLVSGACLAEAGHIVTCVDVDRSRVAQLSRGELPIYEPGLAEVIDAARAMGTLHFVADAQLAAATADLVFIAVGTPSRESDGHADLSSVYRAVADVAPALREGAVIVVKSTVPVGAGDAVERMIRDLRPDIAVEAASNPEFLRAGCAVNDFKDPDRVVIGAQSRRAAEMLRRVYRDLGVEPQRILCTGRRSAELIKYAANGFLATKIAFINEIADLCEKAGACVDDVALGIGLDYRIGPHYLAPGPGFGGSCFPKDARALARTGAEYEAPMRIIETVLASNELRKQSMAQRILGITGPLQGRKIALLGLTFKADTDDMRDSPAIALAYALSGFGARIEAYDPVGVARARPLLPKSVRYRRSALEACKGAQAAVVVTDWEEFRRIDLAALKRQLAAPLLIDLRNLFAHSAMRRAGIRYVGIGNGAARSDVASLPRAVQARPRSDLARHLRIGTRRPGTRIAAAE